MRKLTNHPTKRENNRVTLNQVTSPEKLLQFGRYAVSLSIKNTRNGFNVSVLSPLTFSMVGRGNVGASLLVSNCQFLSRCPLSATLKPENLRAV